MAEAFGVPPEDQVLQHKLIPLLDESKTLRQLDLTEGSALMLWTRGLYQRYQVRQPSASTRCRAERHVIIALDLRQVPRKDSKVPGGTWVLLGGSTRNEFPSVRCDPNHAFAPSTSLAFAATLA